MMTTHQRVSSSNLRSVAYDEEGRILEIAFHGGGVYQYRGVPSRIHVGLMRAASKGRYLDLFVKKAGYPYRRVR